VVSKVTAHPIYLPDGALRAASGVVPGLNGLRAVSIVIVLISHLNLEKYVPGGFGVGIFLFISGFLITRLLLAEFVQAGSIHLRLFWLRRVIRLYPPLITMIAMTVGYSLATGTKFSSTAVLASLFYWANYLRIFDQAALESVRLVHTWSLSVEEHFYLFYPPLLILLLRRRALLPWALAAGCVIALGLRIIDHFAMPQIASAYIYNATETRMDFILAGSLCSVICDGPSGTRLLNLVCRPTTFWIGVALILFSLAYRQPFFRDTFRSTIQITALFLMVPGLIFRPTLMAFKGMLNSPVFDWLGRISYDLYLFHVPVMEITMQWAQGLHLRGWRTEALGFGLGIPLSIIAAQLSYRLIERNLKPVRQRLHREHAPPEEVTAVEKWTA
jgi:peptidoglycan/LPS O-acetylase OafA/YrhL